MVDDGVNHGGGVVEEDEIAAVAAQSGLRCRRNRHDATGVNGGADCGGATVEGSRASGWRGFAGEPDSVRHELDHLPGRVGLRTDQGEAAASGDRDGFVPTATRRRR